jgi:hypothetical protein
MAASAHPVPSGALAVETVGMTKRFGGFISASRPSTSTAPALGA